MRVTLKEHVNALVLKNDTVILLNNTLDRIAKGRGVDKNAMIREAVNSEEPEDWQLRVINLVNRLARLEK